MNSKEKEIINNLSLDEVNVWFTEELTLVFGIVKKMSVVLRSTLRFRVKPKERALIDLFVRAQLIAEASLVLVETKKFKFFQSMIFHTRILFEILIDAIIVSEQQDGSIEIEKFFFHPKAARKDYAKKFLNHFNEDYTMEHYPYLYENATRQDPMLGSKISELWPSKNRAAKVPQHWTGKNDLKSRIRLISDSNPDKVFSENWYRENCTLANWHVHSGITGVHGLKAEHLKFYFLHFMRHFSEICEKLIKLIADYFEMYKSIKGLNVEINHLKNNALRLTYEKLKNREDKGKTHY